ncbi:hypothetical protein D3C81_1342450 [compost metagenome]
MGVIITAKRNGFRRCGIAHSAEGCYFPDGYFTAEQLKALKDERMLVVQEDVAPLIDDEQEQADESITDPVPVATDQQTAEASTASPPPATKSARSTRQKPAESTKAS